MKEQEKLEILRDILFTDDRVYVERMAGRISSLEQALNDPEGLKGAIDPRVKEQLEEFTKSIPETLGPTITETLKKEIQNHKDEVVDALYPVLGKMVKRYVAQEIKVVAEKIDDQLGFLKRGKRKLRRIFGKEKEGDLLLSALRPARVEQVFLIETDSGILKASFANTKTIDEDMISGMLTAIKSFVEDAFQQRDQQLAAIEYELYHIHLESFVSHYIAVVVSGNYSQKARNKVQDLIFNFYNKFMAMNLDLVFASSQAEKKRKVISRRVLERRLARSFGNANL